MFNRYLHHTTTNNVRIDEHRAPTDESVRILRDMEDRAEKKVLAAVRVENTQVDMVIHAQKDNFTGDRLYACIYKINGKQMRSDYRDCGTVDRDSVAVGIRDVVAKDIASLLCAQAFQSALGKFDL